MLQLAFYSLALEKTITNTIITKHLPNNPACHNIMPSTPMINKPATCIINENATNNITSDSITNINPSIMCAL